MTWFHGAYYTIVVAKMVRKSCQDNSIKFGIIRVVKEYPRITDAVRKRARDFIDNEKQFQLGFLPTEQSNPITATLEEDFKRSTLAGVQCLQRGDRQMPITMRHVFASPEFKSLVDSMVETLSFTTSQPFNSSTFQPFNRHLPRIIFSGCGATGRLSILLESMWRDFFHRRAAELTADELKLADRCASIMTGGDFALIKSVESFEDYAEGGRRQAAALNVGEGDTFVAITEGGETSSVLGSLAYAAKHGAKCFLVFNNPASILREHLDRCREAIDNPKVTVIDLYCGSMSLAGSTRLQATSSEQLLCSCALEAALCRVLPRFAKETAVKNPLHRTPECWGALLHRDVRCLEWTAEDYAAPGMPPVKAPPPIGRSFLMKYLVGNEDAPERYLNCESAAVIVRAGRPDAEFEAAAWKCAEKFSETRLFAVAPSDPSPLEIWKHLAVKLTFNTLSTGTMAAMGRVSGNWMSWVSISNKKLVDRGIRLISELSRISYEKAAERLFAADEWIASQDWTGKEEPCAVQVALGVK